MRIAWHTIGVIAMLSIISVLVASAFLSYEIWSMQQKINRANLTTMLTADQVVNLSKKFGSEDVCVVPTEVFVEGWVGRMRPGYRPVESIDPDSSLYWAILIFDNERKSYRYFIINKRAVDLDGDKSYCSHDLTVKITRNSNKSIDSDWLAVVVSTQ